VIFKLLLSAWAATSTVAPILKPPRGIPPVPFTVEADRLSSDDGVYLAEGAAVLRRADAVLFADRIRFDEANGIAIAEGNVTAVEGDAVLTCRRVEMKVPELVGGLESGELRIKNSIPKELLARMSKEELRRFGKDQMILDAEQMQRTGARTFEVKGGSFTVCDCGEDSTPSWKIGASSADVDLDSGAWLYWPVFYAKGVPIFALPVFYYPLGDRRSGLLTPRPSFSPVTGFAIAQPVYLVLGESFDLTFEGSYLSDRGAGAGLEFRWAPTPDSSGQINGHLILDFDELYGRPYDKTLRSPIPRYAIATRHRTAFSEHTALAIDFNLIGDPAYLEFADDFIARQVEGSRSRLTIASAFEPVLRVAGGLQLFQDLRPGTYATATDLRRVSLFSGMLPGPGAVRYRFAELRLDALPYALFDGIPFFADATALIHAFAAPRPEIARYLRADFRPNISLPLSLLDGVIFIEPSIAARFTAWTGRFASAPIDSNRAAIVGKASMYTTLWRDYRSFVHTVRPELSFLWIPTVWGSLADPLNANDEVDQLASAMQLRARLINEFVLPTGARAGGFEAWFGRDFRVPFEDEDGTGNSEVVLKGDAPLFPHDWPVRLGASARIAIDPDDAAVTDLSAGLSFGSEWVSAAVAYEQLGDRPPSYLFVAPEELLPAGTIDQTEYLPLADWLALPREERILFKPWSESRAMTASLRLTPIKPLVLGFDIGLTFEDQATSIVRDTRSTVRWISDCNCWSAELTVTTARDRPGLPGISFGLDLSRLGGGF
jgi:hypothetical protein